ncbi:hypothetical protein BDZ97DRAFT_836109 [Flammula alnicola]|nr:hypothetical protein BDZ97DRAFT_836109 [Flammula alnicola]
MIPEWTNSMLRSESSFDCESVAPNSRSSLKRITPENLKNHVPESIHDCVMSYMCASGLFRSTIAIPLWRPSPSLYNSRKNQTRHWGKNVYIGDVGVFNGDGGFDTYFNVFETKEENESRGRTPPANFVRYPKKLSEMDIVSEPQNDGLMIIGFVKDKSGESGEHSTSFAIKFPPPPHKQKDASALHMLHGFLSVKMNSSEEGRLKNYIRRQQTGWYESFKDVLEGRSLVVITTSYRAKTWASAAAKLSKKEGKMRLIHRNVEKKDVCSWVSDDADISTKNGPSRDHIQKIESYFRALGDESGRDEIEECHAVAVEAFYLHEKSSGIGGSTRSRRTTQTAASSRSKFSIKSFSTIKLFSRRAS